MNKRISKVARNLRRVRNVISENFIEFSQNTMLHGFNFIGNRSLSIWERFFFLASFVIILTCVSILTMNIYAKWESTPVLVGFTPHPVLINKYPFPSVTICNVNQARASKVRNLSRDSVEYSMSQTLCARSVDKVDPNKLAGINNRSMFQDFIRETAQPCKQLLVSCNYGTITKSCEDIFKPVLTDEGYCCVFNSLHSSFIYKGQRRQENFVRLDGAVGVDWDPENGYEKDLPKLFYPRVASGTGMSLGLSIVIDAEIDDYYCTSTNGPGFKLLLHNPIEMPSLRENGLYMRVGSEMSFRIAADRSEASPDIRDFSISDRQCVFKSERQLGYFKTYTKRNCEMECLANMTAELCGCISYSLPRTWTNVSTCSLKDLPCQQLIRNWDPMDEKTKYKSCKTLCIQGCFDLTFTPTRFDIPLSSGGYMLKNQMLEHFNTSYLQKNIAVVHFFYKLSSFDGFMRTRYIGATEFMSNTGGLIGLLGFGLLAMAEIFYFLIIRTCRPLGVWLSTFLSKITT